MSKTAIKVVGIVVLIVAVVAAGLLGATLASAQTPTPPDKDDCHGPYGAYGHMGDPMGGYGWMSQYQEQFHAAIAEGLGMTVDDFEAALDSGQTPWQIAQAQGIDQADFQSILLEARETVLAQAVADGVLTQEQADQMLDHMQDGNMPFGPYGGYGPMGGPMGGHMGDPMGGYGWMSQYQEQFHAAIAEGLGMSVDDFETALDSGQTPWQIAQAQGIDQVDFQSILLEAREAVLAQAVADGVLTQEQADQMLDHMQDHLEGGPLPYGMPGGRGWHPGRPGHMEGWGDNPGS